MIDWRSLGGDRIIEATVPPPYEAYRRPIAEALAFFLDHLPEQRRAAILLDQISLQAQAGPEERLVALARHCPALHKLGQVLARDRRLSPTLREHLQGLESMAPTTPIADLIPLLTRELGDLNRLGVTLGPRPLAEASVAVVVPFTWSHAGDRPRRGVFKVLRPGIEERLGQDLELLEQVGGLLDDRCAEFGIPALSYREAFEQVRELLGHEVRLDQEQANLAEARAVHAGDDRVLIPELFPFQTPRVTAMEQVDGRKVTEPAGFRRSDRQDLARTILKSLIARPIWSTRPVATFHADPHAGNLFATPDGRLAILDWSLVGRLSERERIEMAQVLLGALTLDSGLILRALSRLSPRPIDIPALSPIIARWLRRLSRGRLPGFDWLMGLLDEAVTSGRLRAQGDLMMFRKAVLTLDGVVSDVSPSCHPDSVLLSSFLRHLLAEWPARAVALPFSRSFATHLSSADLLRVPLSAPWVASRCWIELVQDLLARPVVAAG